MNKILIIISILVPSLCSCKMKHVGCNPLAVKPPLGVNVCVFQDSDTTDCIIIFYTNPRLMAISNISKDQEIIGTYINHADTVFFSPELKYTRHKDNFLTVDSTKSNWPINESMKRVYTLSKNSKILTEITQCSISSIYNGVKPHTISDTGSN